MVLAENRTPVLLEPLCLCGSDKPIGSAVCEACYKLLSKEHRLIAKTPEGYEAVSKWLTSRKSYRRKWTVISIMQPWASATILGLREWDTRSYAIDYRGPVAIASMVNTPEHDELPEWFTSQLETDGVPLNGLTGHILATGILKEIRPTEEVEPTLRDQFYGNFAPGRFAWRLTDINPLVYPVKVGPHGNTIGHFKGCVFLPAELGASKPARSC